MYRMQMPADRPVYDHNCAFDGLLHGVFSFRSLSFLSFYPSFSLLGDVLLDAELNGFWVGTDDLVDLVTALEVEECWHGADAEFLREIW
jgi:hypothetical protein